MKRYCCCEPLKLDLNGNSSGDLGSNLGVQFCSWGCSNTRDKAVSYRFTGMAFRNILPPPATCWVDDDRVTGGKLRRSAFPNICVQ